MLETSATVAPFLLLLFFCAYYYYYSCCPISVDLSSSSRFPHQ